MNGTRKTKCGDWVIPGGAPGELGYCTRCGQGLKLNLPQPLEVAFAAMKAFVKIHRGCPVGQYHEKPVQTPEQWRVGRDTGTSSLTIYAAITGYNVDRIDIPHDPDDFGRCYRLLKLFPAWRSQLSKVVGLCKKWKPFVDSWDELTALYEEELPAGTAPKLYARMRELQAEA